MSDAKSDQVREAVRTYYARTAKTGTSCCEGGASSCCGAKETDKIGREIGYSDAELIAVPEGANLGLGCGNPGAIAALKPGETVLDLGSGAGFDCLLAAKQVGPTGHIIGVDMTPEMLAKARGNARKGGYANVEFRLGEIEHLPVADNSVDVVISNCVVNLSPDKRAVWAEAFRALKPGGRIAISDMVATGDLAESVLKDLALLSCCVAGAAKAADHEAMLRAAGFTDVRVEVDEAKRDLARKWITGVDASAYVVPASISAIKP